MTELMSDVLDFTGIMLPDEEGEAGVHPPLLYFLRAPSKICCIQVQIHHILCFVGKELSE